MAKKDMSDFLTVSWKEVWYALVVGGIMAIFVMLSFIKEAGSIFNLDWRNLLDAGIMALITSFATFLASLLSTAKGKFIGVIPVE